MFSTCDITDLRKLCTLTESSPCHTPPTSTTSLPSISFLVPSPSPFSSFCLLPFHFTRYYSPQLWPVTVTRVNLILCKILSVFVFFILHSYHGNQKYEGKWTLTWSQGAYQTTPTPLPCPYPCILTFHLLLQYKYGCYKWQAVQSEVLAIMIQCPMITSIAIVVMVMEY